LENVISCDQLAEFVGFAKTKNRRIFAVLACCKIDLRSVLN